MGDPSPGAWSRVHRYASWMHQASVDTCSLLGEETYRKLRLNAPVGGWFPALEGLTLCIRRSNLPYLDLFFSPNLKRISISTSWGGPKFPRSSLPDIASTISPLPTPTLRLLSVHMSDHGILPTYLKDSLSSVILRCGSSFRDFSSSTPLSDAAINHLIHLPHLRTWHTANSPPNYSTSSPPLVFPPLEEFILWEGVAHGWLSLFKRLGDCVSSTQGATPLSGLRESLHTLYIAKFPDPIIDPSFTSVIQTFRNLVDLEVTVNCRGGQCVFKLNDENVSELAAALPRLSFLFLGPPCDKNTCATTVAWLLQISIHCTRLQTLEIHFNTTNIAYDLKNISEDPLFQESRSLRKCTLSRLNVHKMLLTLDKSAFETVARGMVAIFPDLVRCDGLGKLERKIAEVRGVI